MPWEPVNVFDLHSRLVNDELNARQQNAAKNFSIQSSIFLSISSLHLDPNFFMDHITTHPLTSATSPKIVHIQPLPMARMIGCATIPPMQEKMLRTKLLTAIPVLARLGMNSVNMVVAMANTIMEPQPKKKLAINYSSTMFC
jgi:hypothetical protein